MTNRYITTSEFADILGIKSDIPSWAEGSTPSNEEVGTGDNVETIFYLDKKNIIASTYTLFYGAAATTTTELTETTHYTLNKDTGKITLTSAGKTLLNTDKIFASYSYNSLAMSDSFLSSVIDRAEKEVDNKINSIFTDGTATNPDYPSQTEIQGSPGYFRDRIIAEEKPLIDIESALDGDHDISQTTIDLTAGTGSTFPTSGYIIVGSEVISYTGITTDQLTGCVRGALSSTAATHSDLDVVHSTILFTSNTTEGTAVSWTVQPWDTNQFADEHALFYLFEDADTINIMSKQDVANRVKIIYYYGYNTIPNDIKRLALVLAKRMLIQDNIGKAMIEGRNEFRPEMFNVDIKEINTIVDSYIILPMGNS